MQLKIVAAIPEHLVTVVPRPEFKMDERDRARAHALLCATGGFSIIDETSRPLAVFGPNFLNPKVIQGWAIISEDVKKYPLAFHRAVLKLLDAFEQTHGLARMQITVRSDFFAAQKWALALGFKFEGKLRKYGPDGSDHLMYARVK